MSFISETCAIRGDIAWAFVVTWSIPMHMWISNIRLTEVYGTYGLNCAEFKSAIAGQVYIRDLETKLFTIEHRVLQARRTF